MDEFFDNLNRLLLGKGIRSSYHRLRILGYLHQEQGHPTVDEVYQSLYREIPSLSKATVYNTLHTFLEAGLVRTINIDGDEIRYDVVLSSHGHFKCDVCGEITNFSIDIDQYPVHELEKFKIKIRNVYFNGICPNCINQPSEERKGKNGK
ncbi:MAG: Fur family transcriptional regulator [Anaerolineaceae bacterium]